MAEYFDQIFMKIFFVGNPWTLVLVSSNSYHLLSNFSVPGFAVGAITHIISSLLPLTISSERYYLHFTQEKLKYSEVNLTTIELVFNI